MDNHSTWPRVHVEGGISIQMKIRYLTTVIGFLGFILMQGCEDDPLLAPQTGSEEEAGSYGNIAPLQDIDKDTKDKNPEIF